MQAMVVLTKTQAKKRFADHLASVLDAIGAPKRGRSAWLNRRYRNAVSPQAAAKWLSGESIPDQAHLSMICTDLEVHPTYLMTGREPMFITGEAGWPFTFDRSRYDRLTSGQKIAAEGALLGVIVDSEHKNSPKSDAA